MISDERLAEIISDGNDTADEAAEMASELQRLREAWNCLDLHATFDGGSHCKVVLSTRPFFLQNPNNRENIKQAALDTLAGNFQQLK